MRSKDTKKKNIKEKYSKDFISKIYKYLVPRCNL